MNSCCTSEELTQYAQSILDKEIDGKECVCTTLPVATIFLASLNSQELVGICYYVVVTMYLEPL